MRLHDVSSRDPNLPIDGKGLEAEMTELTTTHTAQVDEFLEVHGPFLPSHVIDFALDMRSIIVELEAIIELQERVPV